MRGVYGIPINQQSSIPACHASPHHKHYGERNAIWKNNTKSLLPNNTLLKFKCFITQDHQSLASLLAVLWRLCWQVWWVGGRGWGVQQGATGSFPRALLPETSQLKSSACDIVPQCELTSTVCRSATHRQEPKLLSFMFANKGHFVNCKLSFSWR